MKLSSTSTLRRFARVAAVAAFALAISAPAMSQALTSVSAGSACTKAQLNRKSGTLTCKYDAKTKKYTWTAAAASGSAASTARKNWPSKLVIAAVPSENVATMTLRYQNFVNVIQKETGLPTTFISATDYAGVIEAQIGRAHV